jgi:hypothetical protein
VTDRGRQTDGDLMRLNSIKICRRAAGVSGHLRLVAGRLGSGPTRTYDDHWHGHGIRSNLRPRAMVELGHRITFNLYSVELAAAASAGASASRSVSRASAGANTVTTAPVP